MFRTLNIRSATTQSALVLLALVSWSCTSEVEGPTGSNAADAPWLLLITLDTTRADALGKDPLRELTGGGAKASSSGRSDTSTDEAAASPSPFLDQLADQGIRFTNAYTTAPLTLPSHLSMLTGLLPNQHRIHENSRPLPAEFDTIAMTLTELGYRTAAHISGLPLLSQFGPGRGFTSYDDALEGRNERNGGETTARALETLATHDAREPLFLWVHYYDPHEPYDPPEPFRSQWNDRYLGEIAWMDSQIQRLVTSFLEASPQPPHILVAGDHGEGLGQHGEALHGNLLYDSVARVPLFLTGPGIEPRLDDRPRSIAQVRATLDQLATGRASVYDVNSPEELRSWSLLAPEAPPAVVVEAMKPHLQYGWQPQVAVTDGRIKAVRTKTIDVFQVDQDPGELAPTSATDQLSPAHRNLLRSIPDPAPLVQATPQVAQELRDQLASMGYTNTSETAPVREGGPRPADMTHLFEALDRGSGLFVAGDYEAVLRAFAPVLREDPENLMVLLRTAVAESLLGRRERADRLFDQAAQVAPASTDARHYAAMHHNRNRQFEKAIEGFQEVITAQPDRLEAYRGLADAFAATGRPEQALAQLAQVDRRGSATGRDLEKLGMLHMQLRQTEDAVSYLERAQSTDPNTFRRHLEMGVLYMAQRRLADAQLALDAALERPRSTDRAMALFKRAQVSVLMNEPDRKERVRAAWQEADEATKPLIRSEALFRDLLPGS